MGGLHHRGTLAGIDRHRPHPIRYVLAGHDRHGPGHATRQIHPDRTNSGVGHRGAHNDHMDHGGQDDVRDEMRLSAQVPLVFKPPERAADPAYRSGFHSHA
jgi:hypothetical protein